MERKDWTRIGLAAAVLLVPGGFVLGAALAARRLRATTVARTAVARAAPATPNSDTDPDPDPDLR